MSALASTLLSLLLSAESLRFLPVYKQGSESDCGPAAIRSLVDLYFGGGGFAKESEARAFSGEDSSLAELLLALEEAGLSARARRMDPEELAEALAAGFAPALVHYDRPRGHFALVLAAAGDLIVAADPARGIEVLWMGDFLRRWSGAVLFVDPARLSPGGKALRDGATAGALGRAALLRRGGAAREAGRALAGALAGVFAGAPARPQRTR